MSNSSWTLVEAAAVKLSPREQRTRVYHFNTRIHTNYVDFMSSKKYEIGGIAQRIVSRSLPTLPKKTKALPRKPKKLPKLPRKTK